MNSLYVRHVAIAIMVLTAPLYAQKEADLWKAVAIGDLSTIEQIVESGVDPNIREPNGSTLLIVAAMFG